MASPESHGGLRSAAVFCLCALFAVLAMGLTLLSSGIYRSTVADADSNYTRRTALSYLVNQVRRSDSEGGIAVSSFGGHEALTLTEHVNGTDYITRLYCYDGQLRELYTEAGNTLRPEDGIAMVPLTALSLQMEGGVVRIAVVEADGTSSSVHLAARSDTLAERGTVS